MEQDPLKSAWKRINTEQKSNTDITSMLLEKKHPVLKGIRKQLVIETVAFTAFLFIYFDFFDGDRKPFYANILLVAAMLFSIIHNIIVYLLAKRPVKGNNIKRLLERHLLKLKLHAALSVAARIMAAVCLLLFFTSVIKFNTRKYLLLAVIV